ncbi:putative Ig kappa chain V19-17-like, partial [Triplophysa rosa]
GASDVTQSPSILWVWQKESAEMNCSHSKGASYFHMYWFRQQQGKPMELIAFTTLNQEPDFGTFSKEKYSATKTVAQNGSFTVKKVQADDSGVYLCAVSEHSESHLMHCCTKT